jgi:hypothetical protein
VAVAVAVAQAAMPQVTVLTVAVAVALVTALVFPIYLLQAHHFLLSLLLAAVAVLLYLVVLLGWELVAQVLPQVVAVEVLLVAQRLLAELAELVFGQAVAVALRYQTLVGELQLQVTVALDYYLVAVQDLQELQRTLQQAVAVALELLLLVLTVQQFKLLFQMEALVALAALAVAVRVVLQTQTA